MTRLALSLLAAVVVVGALYALRPAAPRVLEQGSPRPVLRGAIHVHTRDSDGSGTVDQIAAAAARAGLQFVIFTDHGDATRAEVRPVYRAGVLCLDAVEISTVDGHLVALGLPRAPYPLAGEARDVIEDVARLGGVSIAAHPGSPKAGLAWEDWDLPVDGVEWLNLDSEWRDEGAPAMVRALATYTLWREGTLAALLDRPAAILERWDTLARGRRVVALAAVDAHARIGLSSGEPDDPFLGVHLPSYEAAFRTVSIALPSLALSGDAAADGRLVLDAIRAGRVYSTVDALAGPAWLDFSAETAGRRAQGGEVLPEGAPVTLAVDSNAPGDAEVVLLRNGEPVARARGRALAYEAAGERAVFRVEIRLPGSPGDPPVPWVVSNPIYVGEPIGVTRAPRQAVRDTTPVRSDAAWTVETSPRARAALDQVVSPGGGRGLALRWGLGGTASEAPYAALVVPTPEGLDTRDRVMFTAQAAAPMRVSVQLRAPDRGDGERWHRSVYLDEAARDVTIFFDDMTARGPAATPRPRLADVRDLLFVVDTVNTAPGQAGEFSVGNVRYGR